jgi:hypothetical protein
MLKSKDKQIEKGFLYIVTGSKYHDELKISYKQLRSLTNLPICVAAEIKPDFECAYIPITNPSFSYFDKIDNLELTPFKKTVFLDSDISHFYCLDEIFESLSGVDIMASLEASLGLGAISQKVALPNSFPELSSGMLVYNMNENVKQLFEKWKTEYKCLYNLHGIKEDQPSFRVALFKSNIKFSVLPPEYHFIPANFTRVVGEKIFTVHNHSFQRAKQIGYELNNRKTGGYSGYVEGLGVFGNPYAMGLQEAISFIFKANKLFLFLVLRSVYIETKKSLQKFSKKI